MGDRSQIHAGCADSAAKPPVGLLMMKAQEVVQSKTPPLAFSLRATSAYSDRI